MKKVKEILKDVRIILTDTWGWIKSLFILLFWNIKKPAVMYGYSVWWFARKYAERRDKNWKCKWDQLGKQQAIIPIDDEKLIVCSRLEIKFFQRRGLLSRKTSYNRIFKKANYYKSNLNYNGNNK